MVKPYQVFIGCPFKPEVRKNYDKLKKELEQETPLHIVLADTTAISSTDYLLESITSLIRESAGCIFDVSGGNPNVSLEVGVAHALPVDFILTMYTRKPRSTGGGKRISTTTTEGELRPIISDLQGRNRIEYKAYPALKAQLIDRYLKRLPYWRRWIEFKKRKSGYVPYALKTFEEIRTSGRTVRPRIEAILDGTGIRPNDLIDALSQAKLITNRRGRSGGCFYPTR